MAQRGVLVFLFVCIFSLARTAHVGAQVTCRCTEEKDFGSCVIADIPFPGDFPGAAAVVRSENDLGEEQVHLYIADLYEGLTFRYDVTASAGVLAGNTPFETLRSPFGSTATTGLAFDIADQLFYWAIADHLVRTTVDGVLPQVIGPVDLDALQTRLGLPERGTLGGIAYHEIRNTFWGVDIVNDVYFEFGKDGKLIEEEGKPVSFRSPLLGQFGGGVYGNGITFAIVQGRPYFDITGGSLSEGGTTRVIRVHAGTGGDGSSAFKIGDPAGLFYRVGDAVGPHGFLSGVYYFPATCNATNHTEIVLNIATPNSGRPSRIFQISVDDPKAITLTSFKATATGNASKLEWTTRETYGRLEISRRLLPAGSTAPVATFTNPAVDPRELLDRNLGDGQYEYTAKVSPPPPSTKKLPDVKARVTVGAGSVVAHAAYRAEESPIDQEPFAIAFIGSSQRVLVADLESGNAHLYDSELKPVETFAGPFESQASAGAMTTGVAWNSDQNQLVWLMRNSVGNFLQKTDLSGTPQGAQVAVRVPANLRRVPFLGDLSYDANRKEFWAVDRASQVAYSFDSGGLLTGRSNQAQLPVPRTPNGEFGGAVGIVESTGTNLVLDYTVGAGNAVSPAELARLSYTRGGPAGDTINLPGTEILTLDLRVALEANDFGGSVVVQEGESTVEYIVGIDSRTIYKMKMDSGTRGKEFRRGDANGDGFPINISDPIAVLDSLFRGGPLLPCDDAADANDDEVLDISDPINLFNYLFKAGTAPPAPFAACGRDFDDPLICAIYTCR